MPNSVRARCRPIADFTVTTWVCVAMLALLLFVLATQPPRGLEGWSACIAMFVLVGATPFCWLMARARGAVEFDANGVRWRTAFGMGKSARWNEIESTDARMTSTGGKTSHWKFVVKTKNGAFSWTDSFENAEQLAPFGARFCSLIKANPEDWPRRFGYRSSENLFAVFCVLFLSAAVVAILLAIVGARRVDEVVPQLEIFAALYGWALTIAGFALFGAIVIGIPTFFLLFYVAIARGIWERRAETIAATPSGLSWRIGEKEQIFARWDELQTLHTQARGRFVALPFYRLQTERGEISWSSMLCGHAQLSQTLSERAPHLERVVESRLSENLNAINEQDEVVEFRFKTRTLRAMLWGGVGFSLFLWGITIWGPLEPANGSEPAPTWLTFILAIIMSGLTLYGVQLFRRGCIRLDARGIEWRLPFRRRFVAWEEIEELRWEKGLPLMVKGRKIPLCGPSIAPAHVGQLLEIVAKRATRAGGEWKRVDAQGTAP